MKTLYVTDLDGTLLNKNQEVPRTTIKRLNKLIEEGLLFSFATARSYHTAYKVTNKIHTTIPYIVYNGVFIRDNDTIIKAHYFSDSIKELITQLIDEDLYPIIYSMQDHHEYFSYIPTRCNKETLSFIKTREKDVRNHPINTKEELMRGKIFYITLIDKKERLEPYYHKFKEHYQCLFAKDVYTDDYWLEIIPSISKAQAVLELKDYLKCDEVIVFGDGINDIDMFKSANLAYAVENASEQLKKYATGIIGSNEEEGVIKFIEQDFHHNLE